MNRVHKLCYLAALWFHLWLLQGQKGQSGSPANWMELCWGKSFISPTSLDKPWIWSFSLRFSCLSLLTSPIKSILQNLFHAAIRHDTPRAHWTARLPLSARCSLIAQAGFFICCTTTDNSRDSLSFNSSSKTPRTKPWFFLSKFRKISLFMKVLKIGIFRRFLTE